MRICFVSFEYPPNIIGGAGTYAETLVQGLRDCGSEVFVITRGIQSDCSQKTYRLPTSDVKYWRRLFFIEPAISFLNKLNKQLEFDLVHLNEPHIMFKKLNLPSVCTFHSTQTNEIMLRLALMESMKTARDILDMTLKSPVGSICDVFTVRAVDRIICPSPHLATLIRSFCFVSSEKVCVIPNGISLAAFEKTDDSNASALNEYGLQMENYILFVGRLSYFKGVQHLIEAFKTIKKEHPSLKLMIVGSGDFEQYLKGLAHGMRDVIFAGHVSSLRVKKQLYKNCIAVVVPSLYEGLPMVVLEAMACRKPVIASDAGGIPLLIRHGKNGLLVKPRDIRSLEKSIRILIEDANLRNSMGLSGRKLVEKEFTFDKMVSKTLRLYKSLV